VTVSVDRIDLVGRRREVVVVFPNEQEFRVEKFRLEGQLRLKRWQENPHDSEELIALLRLAVPDATIDDLNTLSIEEDVPRILAAAMGKTLIVEEALKNGLRGAGGAVPASPSPPSSPTTTPSTS
jgi:hypothetical protein